MSDAEILNWLDEPEHYTSRCFDPLSDRFGWWCAAWRNGNAYWHPNVRGAVWEAVQGGP